MEGDPFAVDRGDDDRGASRPARRRAISTSAASTRWRPSACGAAIAAARAAGLLGAGHPRARASPSTSSSAAAPAPTSAARRRPCSTRSRASRGEPRNKPPFPVEVGLFGKPTAINNVETLANVPLILRDGGDAFAAIGTEGSTGPKLFCVSGHVARPGIYEVPFGTTLRELLDLAGGVPARPGRSGRSCSAARRASFVGPDALDVAADLRGDPGDRRRPSARASSWSSTRRPTSSTSSAGSPPSSATSRAASASPAGSAPSARRSCWRGWPPGDPDGSHGDELALLRGDRPGDARRLDLRPRPDRVVGHRERPPDAGGGAVTDLSAIEAAVARIPFEPPARPIAATGAATGPEGGRRSS